jgi:hypothetical protein
VDKKQIRENKLNLTIISLGGSHGLNLAKDLLRGSLDETTGDRKVCALLEVEIDLAGCHSAFVDTPVND